MMVRVILLGTLLMAQMGDYGVAVRCWVVDGVNVGPSWRRLKWLSTDPDLGGWLTGIAVEKGDLDAAAKAVGMKSAKECKA